MKLYHKINSIYKRSSNGAFTNEFSTSEIEYLKDAEWEYTEKIDGTNIRIDWNHEDKQVIIGGRTNKADLPCFLLNTLFEMFPRDLFETKYPSVSFTLYGEGYGKKIQKIGSLYLPDRVGFILFDIFMWNRWLTRSEVHSIGEKLQIKTVPIIGYGTLQNAIELVQNGLKSTFGNFIAEGLVLRPKIELLSYYGQRIITKIKTIDFKNEN